MYLYACLPGSGTHLRAAGVGGAYAALLRCVYRVRSVLELCTVFVYGPKHLFSLFRRPLFTDHASGGPATDGADDEPSDDVSLIDAHAPRATTYVGVEEDASAAANVGLMPTGLMPRLMRPPPCFIADGNALAEYCSLEGSSAWRCSPCGDDGGSLKSLMPSDPSQSGVGGGVADGVDLGVDDPPP